MKVSLLTMMSIEIKLYWGYLSRLQQISKSLISARSRAPSSRCANDFHIVGFVFNKISQFIFQWFLCQNKICIDTLVHGICTENGSYWYKYLKRLLLDNIHATAEKDISSHSEPPSAIVGKNLLFSKIQKQLQQKLARTTDKYKQNYERNAINTL